jgi:pimeloyl-ACP methyl ester carboxylesterase
MAEMDTLFVEHDGLRMRAITLGRGEPVMLIHGMPVSLEVWGATLEPLAAEFQVLAMDLPGFGQSSKVALPRLEDFADWLARLLDQLALERVHVVGHSFGGLVALDFCMEHRARVRSLVLVDAVGLGPYTGEHPCSVSAAGIPRRTNGGGASGVRG